MSTLRTSNLIHGSSSVSNVVLDTQGRASFGPDGPNGRAALYVNPQNNRVGVNTESPAVALDVDGAINTTGNLTVGGTFNLTGDLTVSIINAGSGTAAAPSVSVGTTDNGLYSPGTDQVAISTNGTERLQVDSSGRVGIGTSNPQSDLEVRKDVDAGLGGVIRVSNYAENSPGSTAGIYLQPNINPARSLEILAEQQSSQTQADLVIKTCNGAAASEVFRITADGDVGIGTDSPQAKLHVSGGSSLLSGGSGNATVNILSTANATDAGNKIAFFAADRFDTDEEMAYIKPLLVSNSGGSGNVQTGNLAFGTSGIERVRIKSNGDVGVGTDDPSEKLEVVGSGSGGTRIQVRSTSNTSAAIALDSNRGSAVISGQLLGKWNGTAYAVIRFITGDDDVNKDNGHITFATSDTGAVTERLRIKSNGNVGIGTDSPQVKLHVSGGTTTKIRLESTSAGTSTFDPDEASIDLTANGMNTTSKYTPSINFGSTDPQFTTTNPKFGAAINAEAAQSYGSDTNGGMNLNFWTSPTNPGTGHGLVQRMIIRSSGNVGIGTTTPASLLHLNNDATSGTDVPYFRCEGNGSNLEIKCDDLSNTNSGWSFTTGSSESMRFVQGSTERMRIDSSGKVGIGVSNPGDYYPQSNDLVVGTTSNNHGISVVSATTGTGSLVFADGTGNFENRKGQIVYDHSTNSLELFTDQTERLRIDSSGNVLVGKTASSGLSVGCELKPAGHAIFTRDSNNPVQIRRLNSDGVLIDFYNDSVLAGTISVSGGTVSYNGGHLSRWSQLPDGAVRTEILRGSVLSNLDEMCEWGEEDNEQLNRMKVSDVEGDKNVSGVFQAWDDDNDTYVNDFYCAMTGDFVIRIAQGTTVARGDLLMSAGDGTAKPQDDDIIRSKTIAKVTSTNVSETYADGSYCVPCVLMAC